jgi:hypothetical protein
VVTVTGGSNKRVPLVVVPDNLNTHVSAAMGELAAASRPAD